MYFGGSSMCSSFNTQCQCVAPKKCTKARAVRPFTFTHSIHTFPARTYVHFLIRFMRFFQRILLMSRSAQIAIEYTNTCLKIYVDGLRKGSLCIVPEYINILCVLEGGTNNNNNVDNDSVYFNGRYADEKYNIR